MDIIKDKKLIQFIVKLDQLYFGLESYLDLSEMPGSLITNILVNTQKAHDKFQKKSINDAFIDMPFFRISALARVEGKRDHLWNPTLESLRDFSVRHTDKEVIYFEDENYKETVQFFQKQFSPLMFNT